MKSPSDIVDTVAGIINVVSVTGTIDGRIYRFSKPRGSEVRDIVVNVVPAEGGDQPVVQGATVMINCHAKDMANGTPDEAHLEATADAVTALIEAYNSGSTYFHIHVVNTMLLKDPNQDNMSFINIRCQTYIES